MSNLITAHGLTGFTEATFHHLGVPVYSAKTVRKVIGIWDSAVLDGTESLLNWKSVEYEATENDPTDRIYVFTRQGATSDLSAVEWSDPSLNEDTELTGDNRYIQVRVVIAAMVGGTPYQPGYGPGVGPTIERLIVKGITNATSSLFFTEAFELGFFPKSVVVTTESDVPRGALLRIGVSSLDTTDLDEYQFVEADSLEELDQLSITGTKFKLVLEMSGDSGDQIVVHELAAMFSGDGQIKLN